MKSQNTRKPHPKNSIHTGVFSPVLKSALKSFTANSLKNSITLISERMQNVRILTLKDAVIGKTAPQAQMMLIIIAIKNLNQYFNARRTFPN